MSEKSFFVAALLVAMYAALPVFGGTADVVDVVAARDKNIDHIHFDSLALGKCFERISEIAGVEIRVNWADLKSSCSLTTETPVTLDLRDTTVAACMNVLTSRYVPEKNSQTAAWYVDSRGFVVASRRTILGVRGGLIDFEPTTASKAGDSPAASQRQDKNPASNKKSVRGVALDFRDAEAASVFEFYRSEISRRLPGINFVVRWNELRDIGITPSTPMTLVLSEPVSLSQAIELSLEALAISVKASGDPRDRAYMVIDSPLVLVRSGQQLATEYVTSSWYVGDLLARQPNFAGVIARTSTTDASDGVSSDSSFDDDGEEDDDENSRQQQRQNSIDSLLAAIKAAIGPDYWQPAGKGRAWVYRDRLFIRQSKLAMILLRRQIGLR